MDLNTDLVEYFSPRFNFKDFKFMAHKFNESHPRQIMISLSDASTTGPITLASELAIRTLTIWVRGVAGEKFGIPIECIDAFRNYILNTSTFNTNNYKISGLKPTNTYTRPILDTSDRYIYSFDVELNYVRKEGNYVNERTI